MAAPLLGEAGLPHVMRQDRAYALYPRLPGAAVREHEVEAESVTAAAIATALAGLHQRLRTYQRPDQFPRRDLASYVANEALPAIARHPQALPVQLLLRIGGEVATALSARRRELVEQLVHGDPKPSNMLVEGSRVTGFVDFEAVTTTVRLFDPCYFTLTLLLNRWDDLPSRNSWPGLLRSFARDYAETLRLREAERQALAHVLLAVQFTLIGFNLELGDVAAAHRKAVLLRWLHERRADLEL